MSWSYEGVGKPSALIADLDKAVSSYGAPGETNVSRTEFAAAAVGMKALLAEASDDCVYSLRAAGHASWDYEGTATPQRKTSGEIRVALSKVGPYKE
jgi:hypothetical protein